MSLTLPPVGTSCLLERLAPYAPDDFIAGVCPRELTGGRRHTLSAAQLGRTHLLAALTSTHSLNLLVRQLPEQAVWRRLARRRRELPTARMLPEVSSGGGRERTAPHQPTSGGTAVAANGRATAGGGADGRDGFAGGVQRFPKKVPATTRPRMRRWAGAHSRRVRAAGLSATRNTRCGCGCPRRIRR